MRSARGYDRDAVSRETGVSCGVDEDRAQQQFKDETDINVIVRRFGVTGKAPVVFRNPITDFVDVTDYQSAMNAVVAAQREFAQLPAALRKRFGNDPAVLLDFLDDESNRDEAVRLGLVKPPPERDRDGGEVPAVGT